MNKMIALALLAGGVLLLVFGVSEMNSVGSDFSRMFTGAPTDRAIWMLVGGIAAAGAGLAGLLLRSRAD